MIFFFVKNLKKYSLGNIMENAGNYFTPKNAVFSCCLCDFKCFKNSDWIRHINTKKHTYRVSGNDMENIGNYFTPKNAENICHCGKSYSTKSGMWKHKKTCKQLTPNNTDVKPHEQMNIYDLVKYLMKENSELKNILVDQSNKIFDQSNKLNDVTMELAKNSVNNTTNNNSNNTTNSHNKAFNLNLFLNETCKNAMNISDFIDSIKLQLSDFINMGEVGFVEGISNIIVKNLNSLDETVRPIHCTDQKRETFYVKDKNIWEKDDDEKKKMKQMIKNISYKNEKLMKVYKETYPDYNNPDSKRSDQYSKIMIEAMDCKDDSKDKIIRNISKATIIKTKT
jgi:hypothetical protein